MVTVTPHSGSADPLSLGRPSGVVRELPAGPLIGRRALFRQDLSEGPQRPGPGSAIMPGGGVGHGSGSLRPQWPLLGRSCPVATREQTRARVGRQGVGEQVTGWVAWAWAFSGTGVGRTGGGGRLHPSPAPRPRCRSEASTPASRQPGESSWFGGRGLGSGVCVGRRVTRPSVCPHSGTGAGRTSSSKEGSLGGRGGQWAQSGSSRSLGCGDVSSSWAG